MRGLVDWGPSWLGVYEVNLARTNVWMYSLKKNWYKWMSEWKFVTNIFQYSNIFVTLWIKTPYHICKVRVWVRSVRFFYSQCWKLIWLIGAFSRSQLSNFRSFSINPDDLDHPHSSNSFIFGTMRKVNKGGTVYTVYFLSRNTGTLYNTGTLCNTGTLIKLR